MSLLDKVAQEYWKDPDFSAKDVALKLNSTYGTVSDYKHFLRQTKGDVEAAREWKNERLRLWRMNRQLAK